MALVTSTKLMSIMDFANLALLVVKYVLILHLVLNALLSIDLLDQLVLLVLLTVQSAMLLAALHV